METEYIILILLVSIFLYILSSCNKKEKFMWNSIVPRYDISYEQLNTPLLFNKNNSKCETEALNKVPSNELTNNTNMFPNDIGNPEYYQSNNGLSFSCNNESPDGLAFNDAGGDYVSVAPKRDIYYQPLMGRISDDTLSGYPYYKAY